MGRAVYAVGSFFDDHPIVRRWVFPVVFMATLLFPLFALRYTGVQAAQLTGVFLAFSLTVVAFGAVLQKVIEYAADEHLK